MNKEELISAMAKESGLTKAEARKALDAFMSSVKKTVAKNDKVTLVGFGSFEVVQRKAREGRDPRTGKPIKIPAKKVVKFKAGSTLSSAVQK
ncbi:MAG TPA: HU family DNA-binding protein [Bacteroidales bacterium]|jgi:DNA-binding protein HU-beta|nr:HU family DNA-binding protein [Bacteroidota bacterium]NLY22477.1 HU family DNA-binding protein [Bacteroidales bacterium]HOB27668.1 HU family DNA-binding protein [Bacteroidales bacterium]HPU46395.1 HU family DNA-binding protein [Bacteroidales bacterium]HPZ36687.1 HU family DNA-binding protein [Bacteroidales bacterium]